MYQRNRQLLLTVEASSGSEGNQQEVVTVMADSTADAGRGYEASTTGRYVVVLSDEIHGDDTAMAEALRSVTSVTSIASTRDFAASAVDPTQISAADATIFS